MIKKNSLNSIEKDFNNNKSKRNKVIVLVFLSILLMYKLNLTIGFCKGTGVLISHQLGFSNDFRNLKQLNLGETMIVLGGEYTAKPIGYEQFVVLIKDVNFTATSDVPSKYKISTLYKDRGLRIYPTSTPNLYQAECIFNIEGETVTYKATFDSSHFVPIHIVKYLVLSTKYK